MIERAVKACVNTGEDLSEERSSPGPPKTFD